MDYKEEQKEYFKIRQKHSAKIPSFSNNLKVIQDSKEDCSFRRKFTSKLDNSINVFNKKEKFYKKFVNRLKKRIENYDNSEIIEEDEEEGKDKFLNLVNKVMNNQILLTNNNIRLTINKSKKKISKGLKRLTTFNMDKEDDYINNIKLIQRKYKDYKNKEIKYDELVNKEKEYLTIKQIKNKTKEDLEIELIKSIGKIKELFEIIKFYKNKVNAIQFKIAFLKSRYSKMNKENIFQIERQQNIYLTKNNKFNSNNSINESNTNNKNNSNIKKNNINNDINSNINEENSIDTINSEINDNETKKKRISNIKNTKNILKASKINNVNKTTPNKRDTIIGSNYQNYILSIGKNKKEEKQNKGNINVDNENNNININITNNNNEKTYINNNKEENETININNDKINNDAITNENNSNINNNNGTINLNINKDNNNPINNKDDTTAVLIEVEDNNEDKQKRLKKSRGLRKLLAKKSQEKKDNLRKYFIKFYLGGLYMAIRKGVRSRNYDKRKKNNNRAKSAEQRRGTTINFMQDVKLFNLSVKEEEIDNINAKKKELLTKIIYRKDRIKNLIMKTTFEKFNLRAKLLSLKADKIERMNNSKNKNKVKKKGKKSSKSVPQSNNKIEQNNE